MNKKELLKKIQDIYEKCDDLESGLKNLNEDVKDIRSLCEDIPDNENELEWEKE